MIMASSNPLIPISSISPSPKVPLLQISLPKTPLLKISKPQLLSLVPSTVKSISFLAAPSLAFAPPSLAVEIEKAALFDFNLTLLVIIAEFLLLMVALDKLYFTPLDSFMD
ncbi:hypothetical protein QN277_016674 [Acacia crassicarpa]|uniref:Uncharacterized protein n=1 Tax=Acacia crassicarpa TaxID=499986 RepID=A0AAE1MX73_9FABA|nr:hypothetical protein QN277_016674 [Acacia crassicarpa]